MLQNKESQPQQAARYSLSLKLGNDCRSKLRGITPSLSNKGQSAIELIIVVGFFAFAFLIFLLIIHQSTASQRYENRNTLVQDVALQIQQEISLATNSINGYSRQFILPPNIAGVYYEATIIDGTAIYIYSNDGKHALSLPVSNVTGEVIIGTNTILKINNSVLLNP